MSQLDYSTLDDETLVRLVVQARAEALSELYDRYSRLVFSLALNSVGDPATAEEITQDVFLRVWQRARQYRADRAKVSTWLTSITRHRAIDQLRRRGSRPEQHSVAWAELAPGAEPSVNGPEQAAALTMERERVRAAIAQLPEEQQQVLALACFQGLTQSQIAETLDLPLGTVKTRIRLGMQKLRDLLQENRVAG
jgi:RNA polymerase sigma-70 factor (ECF subfamily)